jgi:hypothetical protein
MPPKKDTPKKDTPKKDPNTPKKEPKFDCPRCKMTSGTKYAVKVCAHFSNAYLVSLLTAISGIL